MATNKREQYGNSSISMLKGEERVRKRPAVIFGSDDLEGCKHAVFEILSNAIDEAREGHGDTCSCNSPKQLVHTEHRALPHCSLEPLTEYRAMHSSYTYYISTVFNIQVKFLCCLPDVQTGAHVCIISGLEGPVQER